MGNRTSPVSSVDVARAVAAILDDPASGAGRMGSALAEGAQEITAAWARYAEEVMRHTSEASQALLRAPDL